MPCSDGAQQRQKIIHNRVASVGEESVSGLPAAAGRRTNRRTHPCAFTLSAVTVSLCREAPAAVNGGEIVVAAKEELHAAPLSGKRLLALWNALPGVDKRRKVGD